MDSGHSATGVISRWPNFWSGMKFRCFLCGPIYAGRSAMALMFPGLSVLQVGPTLEVSRLDDRVWEIALADKINVRDAPIAIIPCTLGAKIPGVHPVTAPHVVGPDGLRIPFEMPVPTVVIGACAGAPPGININGDDGVVGT